MRRINSMGKIVYLTESQFREYVKYKISEGIEYSKSPNGSINFRVNSKQDDASNKDADTRVWGKANDILYGDDSRIGKRGRMKHLADTYMDANTRVMQRKSAIQFVNNGFKGEIDYDDDGKFKEEVLSKYQELKNTSRTPEEDLIAWLEKGITRDSNIQRVYADKYARTTSAAKKNKNAVIPRYNLTTVPGTDIQVIALYLTNDFNFSDALKHGKLRQNGLTDELLGITPDERETIKKFGIGKGQYKTIDVTYDNGIKPDIQNNFSLDANTIDGGDHFKKSYGLGDKNYTSVSQFMDKSILTANYALNKIGFKPQYIVSAPSSSRFNEYYCINLSRKLGIEYIKDFFKRNVVNLTFDSETERELQQAGATESDIFKVKKAIIAGIYAEITSEMKKPVIDFVNHHMDAFSNIKTEHYGRVNADVNYTTSILFNDICKTLVENSSETNRSMVYKNIAKSYIRGELMKKMYTNQQAQHIREEVGKAIQLKIGQRLFINLLQQVDVILQQYSNKFVDGFNINPNNKKFKIVDIEQRFRKCIHNVYVVADKELNQQTNQLLTKYKNANFLIFDDDMNSGATLKLVCNALQDKLDNQDYRIKCLVNGFSINGR